MTPRFFITTGGLLAALGVAAGAIGAHLLEERLGAERMESYQTAVRYQTIHAVGLVLVGLMAVGHPHEALAIGRAMATGQSVQQPGRRSFSTWAPPVVGRSQSTRYLRRQARRSPRGQAQSSALRNFRLAEGFKQGAAAELWGDMCFRCTCGDESSHSRGVTAVPGMHPPPAPTAKAKNRRAPRNFLRRTRLDTLWHRG